MIIDRSATDPRQWNKMKPHGTFFKVHSAVSRRYDSLIYSPQPLTNPADAANGNDLQRFRNAFRRRTWSVQQNVTVCNLFKSALSRRTHRRTVETSRNERNHSPPMPAASAADWSPTYGRPTPLRSRWAEKAFVPGELGGPEENDPSDQIGRPWLPRRREAPPRGIEPLFSD